MKKQQLTPEQAKDTGLAILLILLLVVYLGKKTVFLLPAIIVLILTMTWPRIFHPCAKVWFGFSHFLGGIVSKVLLAVIFYLIATPVGWLRRKKGADPMGIKKWKKDQTSVFQERNRTYTVDDLTKPY